MQDLSSARKGWAERRAMETEIIKLMTVEEGVAQFEALYKEYRDGLEVTEPLEREVRTRHLVQLQERLHQFGLWLKRTSHGQPG